MYEHFTPVYRSRHPTVMVMRDYLVAVYGGAVHPTLCTMHPALCTATLCILHAVQCIHSSINFALESVLHLSTELIKVLERSNDVLSRARAL